MNRTDPTSLETLTARLREALGEDAVIAAPESRYHGDRAEPGAADARFLLVLPHDVEGVQATLRLAHETGTPVVSRGAGSGLSGGTVAIDGGMVLSLERLHTIREIDPLDEVAVVDAGVITADLSEALAPLGFFYAPDPASVAISTIGGNIATNAGGLHCAKYGVTRESVLALEVVLADGTLLRTGHRSLKGVTGLDLTQLLIGSEGTLAVVVAATVRIRPVPVARRTVLARFSTTAHAADGVNAISRSPVRPAATELLDSGAVADIDAHNGSRLGADPAAEAIGTHHPDGPRSSGGAVLLLELDGYGIREQTADLVDILTGAGGSVQVIEDEAEAEHLWELRRTSHAAGGGRRRLNEDVAVPKSRLAQMLTALEEIGHRHGVATSAIAHAGDGNLHPSLSLPGVPEDPSAALPAPILAAADEVVRTALELGGTISGEHGIGTAKQRWLDLELSPTSRSLQHRLKQAFDPRGLLNPGKAL
ncbi:FAD-binding oxidoreductase [Brachybacterium vulturis]|uniref:FAD-binding oxidoreductase n=1 Tax=Brachybacterium vulturis TaxID=2017484 RepID=A0A291GS70_9MICO|nr:FAD-linked oxidase C-terminal domain-containing protein [Brachybacterium vulturis]ATG52794.1 FAD-binding oxidoreductase [Brachybacterium vulturis]